MGLIDRMTFEMMVVLWSTDEKESAICEAGE